MLVVFGLAASLPRRLECGMPRNLPPLVDATVVQQDPDTYRIARKRAQSAVRQRRYQAAHKEKIKAKRVDYVAKNKEKIRETVRAYKKKHKEELKRKRSVARQSALEETRAKDRAEYIANRDAILARVARRYAANREKEISKSKAWQSANKEHVKTYRKEYARKNPEVFAAKRHARRARIAKVGGTHTAKDIKELFEAQGKRCAYSWCRTDLSHNRPRSRHVDHIVPLAAGGSNDRSNLQILCRECNEAKGAKDPVEFVRMMEQLCYAP